MPASSPELIQARLQEWLCAHLAVQLEVPEGRVDPKAPMSAYGLDSLKAVAMLTDIEEHVGFEIDPSALWDYPTVEAFTRFLADRLTPSLD
jgi:acyl carrier protein